MTSISLPINQTIYKNVEFDAKKDFDPIVLAGKLPNIIATNKKSDFKTFEDFDEFAKKNPDEIRLGAPGPGSSLHLAYEFYKYRSNTEMIYVPYNGSGPTLNALMGNDIDVVVDNISAVGPHIKNGNIKGLAVTSNVRSKAYPDIPTMEELGYEDFDINSWFGLIAPHGMKKEDRELLNKTIHEAFQKQENIDYLNNLGIIYEKNSTDEFGKFIADETDRWAKVIKDANITID